MLYANAKSSELDKLAEILKGFGISEENVAIGMKYMDVEKEEDNSLLDKIKPIDLGGVVSDWGLKCSLSKLYNSYLKKPENAELFGRYVRFAFAAAGISSIWLTLDLEVRTYDPKTGRATVPDGLFADLLRPRYGDDADSIELALGVVDTATNFYTISCYKFVPDNAKLCMRAVDMIDKYTSDNPAYIYHVAKAKLCVVALNMSSGGLFDREAHKAVEALLGLEKNFENPNAMPNDIVAAAAKRTSDNLKNLVYVGFALASKFSPKAKKQYTRRLNSSESSLGIYQAALNLPIDKDRLFDMTESLMVTRGYIVFVMKDMTNDEKRLTALAAGYPDLFRAAMYDVSDVASRARRMEDILMSVSAEKQDRNILKTVIQKKMCKCAFENNQTLYDFVYGKCGYQEMAESIANGRVMYSSYNNDYYSAYGEDDFVKRMITVCIKAGASKYVMQSITGFDLTKDDSCAAKALEYMIESGAPLSDALSCVGASLEEGYLNIPPNTRKNIARAAALHKEQLAECKTADMCVPGRVLYAQALAMHGDKFRKQLLDLTGDSSIAVKNTMAEIFSKDCFAEDVTELLKAKKMSKREIALMVIKKKGAENYKDALEAAYAAEKSDKMKVKIAELLSMDVETAGVKKSGDEAMNIDETVKKLAKKASKVAWLFDKPFKPVHKLDGTEAGEDYLKAIVLSYANLDPLGRSQTAVTLAEQLNAADLHDFASEVFGRWYDGGAVAKQKWVLYFCAIHGSDSLLNSYLSYIKSWADNMRGAIAAEAVKALALNGSSSALMVVDNLSRKFKNKQVRAAASSALTSAAEQLGITTEELADKIVPDPGFDENLCRVFDYGPRQFNVYIRPSLELEIFNGEKKVKNMPKPGASDDKEKADAAYNAFKEMKKQIKAVVTAQKQRLEYVMMCDRKWTTEGWRELFVKNAIMHCFAIGLVWGIYEDGKLTSTFRYMEDGSFTTSDGDEFELPENALIGLIHPIELDENLLDEWKEQLEDYEITQPFEQLSRKVYTPEESELQLKKLKRFKGKSINSISLINKMLKFGWYKGYAEDAGIFYYFYRTDVTSRKFDENGKIIETGYGSILTFTGTSVVIYDFEGEEVETEELIFYKAGKEPSYWDKEEKGCLSMKEVNARYFSEIILQLTSILGEAE